MTSSQEEFIVESTPVVDLKANGLVQTAEKNSAFESTQSASALSNWDSEKTEVLADSDTDAVAWLTDEAGQKYVIAKFPFCLGRSADCDVILEGKGVSRKHAEVVFQSGRLVINDLESLNGLKVNGYKVARVILEDNDEIRLGDVSLRFHTGSGGSSAKPKESAKKAKSESPKKAQPAPVARKAEVAASADTASKPPILRYTAMLSVMVAVVGLMYFTANWYSKKKHVEQAMLPDTPTPQAVEPTAAVAPVTEATMTPPENTAPAAPSVVDVGPRLSPPPPPSESGSSLPPPTPFGPIASSMPEPPVVASSKPQPKPKKPEPVKAGSAELYPAPNTGVTEAKKAPPVEEPKPVNEGRAQTLLSQADERYIRGDAPALFKDLSGVIAAGGLSAEERGRVDRKLSSLQSLYSLYAEGKDVYARGEKGKAFGLWSQYLAKERSVYPSQRSVYASGVSDVISGEYVQQADEANKAGKKHDAYRLLIKAGESGNSSARIQLDAINNQAQSLYRSGLRQEFVNAGRAREMWQQVVALVPPENEYHGKAASKLASSSRTGE